MAKKILTHNEALDLVYGVIAHLRSNGKIKLTVTEVADVSGVSRSTINSKVNTDWLEVKEVILNNKPSQRVKLAQAEVKERTRWQVEASRLDGELEVCEKELDKLIQKADGEYKKLFDQLHKYVYKAKMLPSKMGRETKALIENQELKKQLEFLEAENRKLKANLAPNTPIFPFIKQNVINVYPEDQKAKLINMDLADLVTDAMYKLDSYFESHLPPKVVYVLSGNFAAGKSTWIKEHKPPFLEPGAAVYFDGTNHTATMRKNIVKHIRFLINRHNIDCKIICVRVMCGLGQCLERNADITRVRYKNIIHEELIKTIDKHFEEVTFKEGFNEIILIGGA